MMNYSCSLRQLPVDIYKEAIAARVDNPFKKSVVSQARWKTKSGLVQTVLASAISSNYAQLVVMIFSLGSFLGEYLLRPASSLVGRQAVLIAASVLIALTGFIASHMSQSSQIIVFRILQTMAAVIGITSILTGLLLSASPAMPFQEVVNPLKGVKILLTVLMSGVIIGVFSPQIGQGIAFLRLLPAKLTGLFAHSSPNIVTTRDATSMSLQHLSSEDYLMQELCH